jgi:hypothetical protein
MMTCFKRGMLVMVVWVLVLSLAGRQQVSGARAEFCTELRGIGTQTTELKRAKVNEPAAKYQTNWSC